MGRSCAICLKGGLWLCIFIVVVIVGASAQKQFRNAVCPFDYILHLGDGFFDTGNAIRILPYGPYLPPTGLPYGQTYPGTPDGRWCDGKLDPDHAASALGFKGVVPYLGGYFPPGYAVFFAVARSPVLDRSFFYARNVRIPAFATSLTVQMSWLRKYFWTVAHTHEEIADILSDTLFFFGDTESNDLAYPLLQGKSFQEAQSYIPYVIDAQIKAAREVIKMGATRIIFPGGFPIGCYPYILTELASDNPEDYDEFGCLKTVNDLVIKKNDALQQAINALQQEFPDYWIQLADFYDPLITIINNTINSGASNTLQACCGEGGKYNFNSSRLCGTPGVPVCSNPKEYLFWDGFFLTDQGNFQTSSLLKDATLGILNCTSSNHLSDFYSPHYFYKRPLASS